ncbi:MAG: BamA/TamA family outer membrane protein [Cyclobacteriaceae bacterium]
MINKLMLFILWLIGPGLMAQEDTLQSRQEKKLKFAIYPAASYTPETSLSLGAVTFFVINNDQPSNLENYRPTSISPYVVYSLRNQLEANIDFDIFLKNGTNLNITTRYFNFPDFFYGTGNATLAENEESFTNNAIFLEGSALKPLHSELFLGINFDLRYDQLLNLDEDGMLTDSNLSGVEGGFISGFGPSVRLDSRDNVLYPSRGNYFDVSAILYPELLSTYNFSIFSFDFRKYMSLGNEKNILAMQLLTRFSSGDVPFYKLPKLGGSRRLRGISHANRYIDKNVFYMQAEYRRDLFWRFGGVLFAGFGDVAHQVSDYNLNDMKVILGVGGRFKAIKGEKLNARIDLGFSLGNENGIYFVVRESF